LKNNLENKSIELKNIKKKTNKILKAEFIINWENLIKKLKNNNICEIKK
jgi:hypothetical protein